MKLDLLVFSVHPDDAELGCAGTILKLIDGGKKVGIIDLTQGELGSRGSASLRLEEAQKAGEILGLSVRENLAFRDGFFRNDEPHQLAIIQKIRQYQPELIITNAIHDRHPDHGRASKLVVDATFLSGLIKIETNDPEGQAQKAWRPKKLFHFIQDHYIQPDFVVDIGPYYEKKLEAIKAFRSQFYEPNASGPETYISSMDFWNFLEARSREYGHAIGVTFGEGFTSDRPIKISSPLDLL